MPISPGMTVTGYWRPKVRSRSGERVRRSKRFLISFHLVTAQSSEFGLESTLDPLVSSLTTFTRPFEAYRPLCVLSSSLHFLPTLPMATPLSGFQALPPELVSHIISLAAPIAATEDPVARRQRWRTLNGICLVSSEWRTVAQKILLSDGTIRLNRTKELDALIDLVVDIPEQGITKLVRSLDVTMWGQEPGRLVELLSLCENLEELVIEHVDRVRLDQIITPSKPLKFTLPQRMS